MYVNRNYVNPAVKFRYPNAIELRPLKCCICPKLTPGLNNFEHGNACFVHLVTIQISLRLNENILSGFKPLSRDSVSHIPCKIITGMFPQAPTHGGITW